MKKSFRKQALRKISKQSRIDKLNDVLKKEALQVGSGSLAEATLQAEQIFDYIVDHLDLEAILQKVMSDSRNSD